ncbi:MAG: restriction endonuclease subunit S, partial [Kiritimatiellia bacterium]|nr:restriction endonuclease subunit S [Kiritimatiellia bacterium]
MRTQNIALISVAKIIMGTSPKGNTYNDTGNGLPLINGPTEFGDDHPDCTLFTTKSSKECNAGDLIFCVRGSTTGRMNWADKKYSLGRGVCSIR